MSFSTLRNPHPFFPYFLNHLSIIVSVPYKISLNLAPGPDWIIKAMALSLMGKYTIYILSENVVSVIIIMNVYLHIALKIYLKLCRSAFFYHYCYRVHFSRLTIFNFLSIFIMENDFLIHLWGFLNCLSFSKQKANVIQSALILYTGYCSMKSYSFLMALFWEFTFIHLFNEYWESNMRQALF